MSGESPFAAIATVPAVLGGLADIAAFFRTDQEFKGRTIDLAEEVLVAELARALLAKQWTVHLPEHGWSSQGKLTTLLGTLITKRSELRGERDRVARLVEPKVVELAEMRKQRDAKQAELARLEKTQEPNEDAIKALKEEIRVLNSKIGLFSQAEAAWTILKTGVADLITAFDAFEKALSTATSGSPAPIDTLAAVDLAKSVAGAHLLQVSIPSQGAEIHISKSAWSSARITYVGGSVCVYFWMNDQGMLKGSGSLDNTKSESFRASEALAGTGS